MQENVFHTVIDSFSFFLSVVAVPEERKKRQSFGGANKGHRDFFFPFKIEKKRYFLSGRGRMRWDLFAFVNKRGLARTHAQTDTHGCAARFFFFFFVPEVSMEKKDSADMRGKSFLAV